MKQYIKSLQEKQMYKKIFFAYLFIIFTSTGLCAGEIAQDTPMENKKIKNSWGVEINPFKLAIGTADDGYRMFAGGVSYFNYENNTEIALPINYNTYTRKRELSSVGDYDYIERDLNIDIHFRQFIGPSVGGSYFGVFARYTFLEGKLKDDNRFAEVHKFGMGVEFGVRVMQIYFFDLPLYWGASVAVGKYFGDNNDIFLQEGIAMEMDDREIFFDVELLKIGLEF